MSGAALHPLAAPTPAVYVVGFEDPHGKTWFLNAREQPGHRVAALVTPDRDDAAMMAARTLIGNYHPDTVSVYQLTDNTAGVMGALLEVMRFTRVVPA